MVLPLPNSPQRGRSIPAQGSRSAPWGRYQFQTHRNAVATSQPRGAKRILLPVLLLRHLTPPLLDR